MKINYGVVLGAVLGLATSHVVLADAGPTALSLIKSGDDYVGIPCKDRVLEIYADKSVASMAPNVWHIVYYDPSVFSRSVEVKFGAGQEMEVSHPMRPFMLPARASAILDPSRLKVDSDRALQIATSQPILNGITLRSSKMTLENSDDGPIWKVELYAAKVGDPTREVSVGYVTMTADDGTIVKADLHPSSVDE
jgi:hypothetical protein